MVESMITNSMKKVNHSWKWKQTIEIFMNCMLRKKKISLQNCKYHHILIKKIK